MSECFLSLLVARWRAAVATSGATGTAWPLRVISFMHPRPDDVSEHRRIFAAELCFERDYNAIDFDRVLLDAPFAAADAGLNELLGRTAERMVRPREVAAARAGAGDRAADPVPDPRHAFRDHVRAAAIQAASAGDFSVDAIARQLKLGKRTLQRKLREDQVSADVLIDDIRRDLAMRCLEQRRIAIAEVAALVGFSDLSAFYRAFKRWTGTTPRRYLDAR
jgi:AraC-like DNA-binding protein